MAEDNEVKLLLRTLQMRQDLMFQMLLDISVDSPEEATAYRRLYGQVMDSYLRSPETPELKKAAETLNDMAPHIQEVMMNIQSRLIRRQKRQRQFFQLVFVTVLSGLVLNIIASFLYSYLVLVR